MLSVIIESFEAYLFAKNKYKDESNICWNSTSPYILYKLNLLGENVKSLEKDLSINKQREIGDFAINFGNFFSNDLNKIFKNKFDLEIGSALKHRIQVYMNTLIYKSYLLQLWYKKNYRKKKLIIVGDERLKILEEFDLIHDRFDNLYFDIVLHSNIENIELVRFKQSSGRKVLEKIERKTDVKVEERILYFLNNFSREHFSKIIDKYFQLKPTKNYKLLILKQCSLIDESLKYFKKYDLSYFKDPNFLKKLKIERKKKSKRGSDLEYTIGHILSKLNWKLSLFDKGSFNIFTFSVINCLEFGVNLIDNCDENFYIKTLANSSISAVVTNGLTNPTEKLFQQYNTKKGIDFFSFEHGLTAGLCSAITKSYFSQNLYTAGGDHLVCYNEQSFKHMNKFRKEKFGIVSGVPRKEIIIKFKLLQRFIGRRFLGVNNNKRTIFFVAGLTRNNAFIPNLVSNDLDHFKVTNTIVFKVFSKVNDFCLLKLYPSIRYIDPEPWIEDTELPSNVKVVQYFDFSLLRASADVLITYSTQSTFAYILSAKKPIVFLDLFNLDDLLSDSEMP